MVNLTDASGVSVADYSYDTWGALTNSSETIPNANGWVNPYRYDGRDGVRSDVATGLDWMAVRAYDPTWAASSRVIRWDVRRCTSPTTRMSTRGTTRSRNVDPSGQYRAAGHGATTRTEPQQYRAPARVTTQNAEPQARRPTGQSNRV